MLVIKIARYGRRVSWDTRSSKGRLRAPEIYLPKGPSRKQASASAIIPHAGRNVSGDAADAAAIGVASVIQEFLCYCPGHEEARASQTPRHPHPRGSGR